MTGLVHLFPFRIIVEEPERLAFGIFIPYIIQRDQTCCVAQPPRDDEGIKFPSIDSQRVSIPLAVSICRRGEQNQ